MKKLGFPLCLLVLLLAGVLPAQQTPSTFQGTVTLGAEQHRVALQMSPGKDGGWASAALYIEFVPDPLHVDSLAVSGSRLKLAVDGAKGTFDGKIGADGESIAGTWTYDRIAAPLELRRVSNEAAWRVPFQYQYHYRQVTYARPSPDEPKIPFSAKLARDYMETGTVAWTVESKCVACHTNGSYMVVRPLLTAQLGTPNPQQRDFFVSTLRDELASDPKDLRPELDSTQSVYLAAGLAIWDAQVTHRLSPETAQALDLMFRLQREDGDWTISDDNNPPLESSRYQLATVAARAVGNAPGWLAQQRGTPLEAKINLLENYLRAQRKLQGDYDRTDLLWAATELPGLLDAATEQQLIRMIRSHQRADGGWSMRNFAKPEEWGKGNRVEKLRAELELSDPPSDGHMTGLAIIALRKAGVPANDPQIQRGVAWLMNNQRASGRWWTRSLNRDGWQFITYSGTEYPLLALALCNALPTSGGL